MSFLARTTIELANEGLVVSGEVNDPAAAAEVCREQHPDIVLLDYRMPSRNGIDVARDILAANPQQPIVLFSAYFTETIVDEAVRIGVRECVSKDEIRALPEILRKYCAHLSR